MKTVCLPTSICDVVNDLDSCDAGELLKAILSHYNGVSYKFQSSIAKAVFITLRPQLNDYMNQAKKRHERHVMAGKKSAEARIKRKSQRTNNKAKVSVDTNKTLEQRKLEFKKEIIACKTDYDIGLLEQFFIYWSEHGANDKKMRFEKERTFGIKSRLHTWYRFDKERKKEKPRL